jgi:DNA modification methylase
MLMSGASIICGDAEATLRTIQSDSVALTVTSPPYFRHRDYRIAGQLGQEPTLSQYLNRLELILSELLRVTDDAGSCFVVIGDTYVDRRLQLVPHRLAILASELGWTIRNDVIWRKASPAPESVKNRWRGGHEHVLFMTKRPTGYRFNTDAIRIPHSDETIRRWGAGQQYGGSKSRQRRNARDSRMRDGQVFELNPQGCVPTDVWQLPAANLSAFHYAAFPAELARAAIEACSAPGDLVLDPFVGSGTTCVVARQLRRRSLGIELNPEFAAMAQAEVDTGLR